MKTACHTAGGFFVFGTGAVQTVPSWLSDTAVKAPTVTGKKAPNFYRALFNLTS